MTDSIKAGIKQNPQLGEGNPNDSLATAVMDDTVITMDSAVVYMGQPHSTLDKPRLTPR